MRDDDPPAPSAAPGLERALSLLALRLRHEVALHRALRGTSGQEGFGGLLIDGDEAERLMEVLSGRLVASGTAEPEAELARLEQDCAAARLAEPGLWPALARVFALDAADMDLLTLALAPLVDPRFGRAYGFLNDDMTRRHLTPHLALHLLRRHGLSLADLRDRLAPDGRLIGWGLLTLGPERPLAEAPLRADETLLDRLLHPWAAPVPPPPAPDADLWLAQPGADTLARLTAASGRPLHRVRAETLGRFGEPAADWRAQARDAALQGALPVLLAHPGGASATLAAALMPGQALVTDDPQAWLDLGLPARLLPPSDQTGSAPAARLSRDRALAGLADPVRPALSLDDLILTPRCRSALLDLTAAAGQRARVLQDWGLARIWGKAPGLSALLRGPSGTGKTSAAGALALALGLPLYRVNLAGLMSKYIGETEKHLDRLFHAAAGQDLILFFDEADAAFGKRSDVTDAHDRYANLGTAFLLQRLETHPGLTLLATNLQDNIDDAFLRRIDAVIDFPPPAKEERLALWQRLLLTDAPRQALDLPALSDHALTGAEIRNACLTAAYKAAEAGQPLTMAGLSRAIAGELAKKGRPLRRSDFKDHFAASRGA